MKDPWFLPEYRGWQDLFGRWTNPVMILLGVFCGLCALILWLL